MYLLLLLVSLATAGPAGPTDPPPPPPLGFADTLPPPPTAKEVEGWDALTYYKHLSNGELRLSQEFNRRVLEASQVNGDPIAARAFVARLREVAQAAARNLRRMPPFQGDARLRDTLLANYEMLLALLDGPILEAYDLQLKVDPRAADLARMEALVAEMEQRAEKGDLAIRAAILAFGDTHGIRITFEEAADAADPYPPFEHPGLVPEGSRLSAGIHVCFAIGHVNGLLARQRAIVVAMNAALVAPAGEAAEGARVDALKTVRSELAALRSAEPWRGDDGLLVATRALAEGVEELLANDLAILGEIAANPKRSQEDADRANAIARELNPRYKALVDGFIAAQDAFAERWAFDAYDEWKRTVDAARAASAQSPP